MRASVAGAALALWAGTALAQDATQRLVVGSSTVLLVTTATSARVLTYPGTGAAPASPRVLWEGPTTWQGEDRGLRTRDVVTVADGTIVREHYEESGGPCGLGEFPSERWALEPSLRFARTPNRRLLTAAQAALASAEPAPTSVVSGAPPSLPLRGAGVHLADGTTASIAPLVDADARTAITFAAGSYVTIRPTLGPVSLRALELSSTTGADLPHRWLLVSEPGAQRRAVTLTPEVTMTARRAGRVRVMLPTGDRATCVALIALDPGPVATLGWTTSLDSSGDGGVASLLAAAEGPDGDAALRLALSLGEAGERAVIAALPTMSTLAARRAVRALAATGRAEAVAAVARSLARDEVAAAAEEALNAAGAPAMAAVGSVVAEVPRALRVIAGMRLPWAARLAAATPLLGVSDDAWREALPTLRTMLSAAAREEAMRPWVEGLPTTEPALSRGLRVASEAMATSDPVMPRATERARVAWESATDFATRWRLLSPLAGDAAGRTALGELLAGRGPGATDADLRAEAARSLGRYTDTTALLVPGLGDAVPRVRVATATALRGRAAVDELSAVLARDGWPTVRAAAAESLAPRAEALDALRDALDAHGALVVRASLRALGESPAPGATAALMAFAQDGARASLLRREALEAVAVRCDAGALTALEALASTLGDSALPPYEQDVGHTALAAMAHIDAARARAFMQRSEANPAALAAVERASRGGCPAH